MAVRQWLNVVIGQHVNQRRYSDCTRRYSLAYQMISSRVLHAVRRRGINIILIALDTHAVYAVNTHRQNTAMWYYQQSNLTNLVLHTKTCSQIDVRPCGKARSVSTRQLSCTRTGRYHGHNASTAPRRLITQGALVYIGCSCGLKNNIQVCTGKN